MKVKLAAQAIHAALGLQLLIEKQTLSPLLSVIVLGISDKKFDEAKISKNGNSYIVRDAGYTEVPPGTETCMAFLEEDIREDKSAQQ